MIGANNLMQSFLDLVHQWSGSQKKYRYTSTKTNRPETAYGRFLTIVSAVLFVLFLAIHIFASISISASVQQQKLSQSAAAEKARCADNPWAVNCPER